MVKSQSIVFVSHSCACYTAMDTVAIAVGGTAAGLYMILLVVAIRRVVAAAVLVPVPVPVAALVPVAKV